MTAGPDTRFSADHLWLRRLAAEATPSSEVVTVGVTERIARILTLVEAVSLPAPGDLVDAGEDFATIDSQKTVLALPAPVPLQVVAVNEAVVRNPLLVRLDPRGSGWLVQARLTTDAWKRLLRPADYDLVVARELEEVRGRPADQA